MWMTLAALATEPVDPYLWLEDVDGRKALHWVSRQNKVADRELTRDPAYGALRERLLDIFTSDARIPTPTVLNGTWYNFWQDEDHVQGVWRRTTAASYRTDAPAWETVLDLDALSAAEGRTWVWAGANCLPPEYRRCMVALSDGGSDATVKREFDTVEKKFVEDGFELPAAKSRLVWVDADTLYVSTDWGPETLTDSGYPRQVRRWTRGTPFTDAVWVAEAARTDVAISAWVDHAPGFYREGVYLAHTRYESEQFLFRNGQLVPIEVPRDAQAALWREWLLIELRSPWEIGGQQFLPGSLLAAPLEPFLAGERNLAVVFEPTPTVSLEDWSSTRQTVVLSLLDNVRSRTEVVTPPAITDPPTVGWSRRPMEHLPTLGQVAVWPVDADRSDEVFVLATDFLTPSTLLFGAADSAAPPTPLKALPPLFEAADLEVNQFFATSLDGTRVPYFQVSRKGLALDGKNPTAVYGYGGFEQSMLPSYSATVGAAWLERGGVYVLANIRGGGEYGPAWHQAALKANRHKAYEDFAAVSQDLIDRGVSSPAHLGAMGGSNGGLLVGNMAIGWPHLYGAIACQVPLLDMRRYSQLLAGASWMGEYGNPEVPEDWSYIQTFSPYHLVRDGVDYPRILFTTSTRDDRVHPGHARKMVAKMKAQGHDVLYWENTQGGHGGAANHEQRATMWAMSYLFLWNELASNN